HSKPLRAYPGKGRVVLGVGITHDGWPHDGSEVDGLLWSIPVLSNNLLEARQVRLRRQRVIFRFGQVRISATRSDIKVRFVARRLITQPGARGVIGDEFAPAVDG